jgi:serine/threonine protein phosphatase PrpC
MILASDGLWEFISNEQAMEAVIPCFMRNDIEEAVKLLEQLALSAWVEEDELIDDITIEVVFFKNY